MNVELIYFQESGKYYCEGKYSTDKKNLWEIWAEVEEMSRARELPGLIENHSYYIVSVDVPAHPHNHPHLVKV